MSRRVSVGLLCAVVVAGAVLRLYGLSAKSLWLDEAMSWQMQRFPAHEIVERCADHVGTHPPLYFVMLHFWTRIFGESEIAMRSLAAVTGIAVIPAVYFMMRALMLFPRLDSRVVCHQRASWAGLLAAALVAVSPLHIHLSQQVRGYSLAVLLVALTTIALLHALRGSGGTALATTSLSHPTHNAPHVGSAVGRGMYGAWAAFVVFAAGAAYTSHLAVVSIVAQCAFAAGYVVWSARHGAGGRARNKRLAFLFAALVALAVAYAPWVPRLFAQSQSLRESWHLQKTASEVADTFYGALVSTPVERLEDQGVGAWIAMAAVAGALVAQWRSRSWGGRYLALAGALPAAFLIGFSLMSSRAIVESRYLVFAQLHWLCAAAGISAACRGMVLRTVAGAALAAFSIGACADSWPELGHSSSPDMRGAAEYIHEHRQAGDMAVARGSNVFFELSYYLRGDAAPLLAAANHSRGGMFGLEHFADDDLITFAELLAQRPAGAWIVESETFAAIGSKNMASPSPRQWETVSRRSFTSDYNFERPIVVSYLRPRSKEGG